MPNFAEQLFGLSKRYAGGEKPTGQGGMFGALAYKLSQNPAFQKHYGQGMAGAPQQPPMMPMPQQPQFQTANPMMTQGMPNYSMGGQQNDFNTMRKPGYNLQSPQMGELMKFFSGFGR